MNRSQSNVQDELFINKLKRPKKFSFEVFISSGLFFVQCLPNSVSLQTDNLPHYLYRLKGRRNVGVRRLCGHHGVGKLVRRPTPRLPAAGGGGARPGQEAERQGEEKDGHRGALRQFIVWKNYKIRIVWIFSVTDYIPVTLQRHRLACRLVAIGRSIKLQSFQWLAIKGMEGGKKVPDTLLTHQIPG